MSLHEDNFRDALLAHAPLAALVGDRVAVDEMLPGQRPFVIFTRSRTQTTRDLSGTVVDQRVVFAVQVWGDSRDQVSEVADEVEAALAEADQAWDGRASVYDDELELEGETLEVDWWPDDPA